MNSRLFLRLTTTALFATFLASCATLKGIVDVKKPTAEVAGVSLGSLSLEQATLLVDVAVSNPNGFALDAAGFDLDLGVAGSPLASVNQPDATVTVPANGTESVQLPVTLKFTDLANAIGGLSGKNAVDYTVDGNVLMDIPVMGNISIPVDFKGTLPIPQLPQISFSDISLSDVSWSGAKLMLSLDVENPNAFGLDLKSLAYNLQAEGKSLGKGTLNSVKLEQGQSQKIDIPLEVSLTNLGISLFRMLSGGEAVKVGIDGSADVAPDISLWKPEPLQFKAERTLNP